MPTTTVRVNDIRTASADVFDMPELRTVTGRDPIDPCGIDVEYSIATGRPRHVQVRGYRPGALSAMTRTIHDIHLNSAPSWVRQFIAKHAPIPAPVIAKVVHEWRTGDGIDATTEADHRLWTALDELCHADDPTGSVALAARHIRNANRRSEG